MSQTECPPILCACVLSICVSNLEYLSYGIFLGKFLYTWRSVLTACHHLLFNDNLHMSAMGTGKSAITRTKGSDLLVSVHFSIQWSHNLTFKYSDRTCINDGMTPLPAVHAWQKTCPHSLQWCFRTNMLKYVPHTHLSTSLSDCHI